MRTGLEHIPDQQECAGPALERECAVILARWITQPAHPGAREGFLLPVLPTKEIMSCTGAVHSAPSDCSSLSSGSCSSRISTANPELWAKVIFLVGHELDITVLCA